MDGGLVSVPVVLVCVCARARVCMRACVRACVRACACGRPGREEIGRERKGGRAGGEQEDKKERERGQARG